MVIWRMRLLALWSLHYGSYHALSGKKKVYDTSEVLKGAYHDGS